MIDPWQRARDLARMQAEDEEIVGALVEDLGVDEARAAKMTTGDAALSLLRARQAGKASLRERVWQLAHGDVALSKTNGAQLAALQALLRAHVGHGESFDAAQLRDYLADAKRKQKAGGKPRLVGAG